MSRLRRIVMVRHGETDGESSIRFHGSADVPLSDQGRAQMRAARNGMHAEFFELVAASPLRRSWEAARIVSGGAPVRLEGDFREIDFGRWEGLTAEEIAASDPVLYRDWREKATGFEFPGGEARKDFTGRVHRGLERIEGSGATGVLLVAHKGVIRTLAEKLLGTPLAEGEPQLGGVVSVTRAGDGSWFAGRRGSRSYSSSDSRRWANTA